MKRGIEFRRHELGRDKKGGEVGVINKNKKEVEGRKEQRESRFDSNIEGKITALDFVFDAQDTELEFNADDDPKYASVAYWQDLLFISNVNKDIPADIALNIHLVGPEDETEKIEDHVKAVVEFSDTSPKREINISRSTNQIASAGWIRDNAVRASNGKEIIMTSVRGFMNFERIFDRSFLETQLAKEGQEVVHAPFYFDGGNIRSADGVVFLGPQVLRNNVVFSKIDSVIRTPEEEEKLLVKDVTLEAVKNIQKDIEKFLQGETQIVGGEKYATEYEAQPIYHIDLFFTPLGDDAFAIGDTNVVADLMREYEDDEGNVSEAMLASFMQILKKEDERLGDNFDEYIDLEYEESDDEDSEGGDLGGGSEMVYPMGSFALGDEYLPNMFNDRIYRKLKENKNLENAQGEDEALLHDAIQFLDDTQKQISSMGSRVVKVPFIPLANPKEQKGAFITYNNVLIDRGGEDGKPRVFLPYYGKKKPFSHERDAVHPYDFFERLDEIAYKAYAEGGYEVVSIGNRFDRLARNGALNCSLLETRDFQDES
jgi:hypothetical protein